MGRDLCQRHVEIASAGMTPPHLSIVLLTRNGAETLPGVL